MLKPKIHLCLVHNTATANVTPALDPDFRPDEVILLHGPKEDYHANCIEAVLKPVGIKVSRWKIQDTWTVEHICDRILELMAERENDDIALNASGGTRPMSIAAYEVFKEFNKPIFYANPETDYISWINRRDFPSFDIADRIKLPAFLHANGAQVSNQGKQSGVPSDLRHLTQELVKNSKILAKPLAAINWLAQQAELDLKSPILSVGQQNWYELQVLINQFAEAGLLESKQDRLYFKDEAARFFVNGGWLEVYTYGLLYGLRGEISKIQDVGRSIELNRDSTGKAVRNELDVAFLHNNHLYIIECKTKRFINTGHEQADSHAVDALYKLDTLKWLLGGVRTKVMLVSYQPLSIWDKQRAKDLEIATCTDDQLVRLETTLKRWMSD